MQPAANVNVAEPVLHVGKIMTPSELSRDLREGHSPDLTNRRRVFGLSMAGVLIGQIVSLYQLGIIKKLPDPPIGIFDSNKVNASDYAYKRGYTPDAVFMIFTYATTAWLAAMGGKDRSKTMPLISLLMGAKALFDVLTNLELAREEWNDNKKFCAYCQSATIISLITVLFTAPEAIRAAKSLLGEK